MEAILHGFHFGRDLMATATLECLAAPAKLHDLLDGLGNIPPERILVNPPLGTATEQDLLVRLDASDKRLCELVNGVLVEKSMGARESFLAAEIAYRLRLYLSMNDIGFLQTADGPIRIELGRIRLPDVSLFSWKDVKDHTVPNDPILDIVPMLAIEILSESNTPREIEMKLDDYFHVGVKLAWLVDPEHESLSVWTSRSKSKVLTRADTLEGGKVLPGFSLPIAELFARTKPRKKK